MNLRNLRDINVLGKTVLLRADFNERLDGKGNILDDFRLRMTLPTINYLLSKNAKVIIITHLGRPNGKEVDNLRVDSVAVRLEQLLEREVAKLNKIIGQEVDDVLFLRRPGEVTMLENLRFDPREEKNDPGFAKALAAMADVFVFDAFGVTHRAHASVVGIPKYIPSAVGFLVEREVAMLETVRDHPNHPLVAVVGGVKFDTKIGLIERLAVMAEKVLIGGALAGTFAAAMGYRIGQSLVEIDYIPVAKNLMQRLGDKLIVAPEVVVAKKAKAHARPQTVALNAIPDNMTILDIGPKTVELFGQEIAKAKTVLWNGPMGVFEYKPFAAGTQGLAKIVAGVPAQTYVGGGETVDAINDLHIEQNITHLSTGGGAMVSFLEDKDLPGLDVYKK